MGARYYNPMLGRFLSIDPIEPDENNLHSLNRYAYANNNPYKFVDPDGQAAETVIDVISLGLSIKAWRQDPSFVNALAVAYDGFATAIPVLPGGIGIIRQASSKGGEITQAVRQAADGGAARAGEGVQKTASNGLGKYEVGAYDALKSRSVAGDGLDIHHAMQKQPAGQAVKGYDPMTAPSISLPRAEHAQIPNLRGQYKGSARDLLARDIRNLRNHTNAPNSSLQRLIDLNKQKYPGAMGK